MPPDPSLCLSLTSQQTPWRPERGANVLTFSSGEVLPVASGLLLVVCLVSHEAAPVSDVFSLISLCKAASVRPPASQALSGLNGFETGATAALIALLQFEAIRSGLIQRLKSSSVVTEMHEALSLLPHISCFI